jgi:hypothetical protein
MCYHLKVGEYVGFTFTKLANIADAYICALAKRRHCLHQRHTIT